MNAKRSLFLALAVSMLGAVACSSCSPTLVQTDPKLPPGFLDTQVITGDLNAYLYLSQSSPIAFPLEIFGDVERLRESSPLAERLPNEAEIRSLAIWMGPDLSSFGGDVIFTEEAAAEISELLLAAKSDDVTSWHRGGAMSLVRGTGIGPPYTHLPFSEAYPKAWDLMRLLPESPPAEPVAAGFLNSTSTV
ncbi:MAG: hypothetical protein QGI09_10270, partial [Dehalococcoidia bacterium]|nr:hypothetical protein [Dehalococcoidia bacterium]